MKSIDVMSGELDVPEITGIMISFTVKAIKLRFPVVYGRQML